MVGRGRLKRFRERMAERRRTRGEGENPADTEQAGAEQAGSRPQWSEGFEWSDRPAADPATESDESGSGRTGALRGRLGGAAGSARALGGRGSRALGSAGGRVRSAGAGLRRGWFGLPIAVRQRVVAGAALAAIVLFVLFVVIPLAPCAAPGGDRCAPDDDAISLVPADSAAYIHVNFDADTDQFEAARALADRLPVLADDVLAALPALTGSRIDLDRDVRPWSGGELAVVLEPDGEELDRLLMIEADDPEAALEFASGLQRPGAREVRIDGVAASVDDRGLAATVTGGFLIVGSEERVAESIALAANEGESLADDPTAERARDELPEDRLADAYLSGPLASRLPEQDQLAGLASFVNPEATEGVALGLTAEGDELAVAVRSVLDPDRADEGIGFFASLEPFRPSLSEELPADVFAYLGIGDPASSATTLIEQAAQTSPALFEGLERFNRRLERRDGVDLQDSVLPLLSDEAALTVEPQPSESGEEPGGPLALDSGIPYLGLIATGVGDEAAVELAELQAPIARSVDPSSGQSPVFETQEIAGVEAQSLRLSPVVDLTYASFDDRLVVGTDPAAVERARSDSDSLADSEPFEQLTERLPDEVSMLLYLNVEQLLDLGEALFLAEDPSYARVAGDLRTLDALAGAVRRGSTELDTDVRVAVGEREEIETPPPIEIGEG